MVVSVISTSGSLVRPTISRIAALTSKADQDAAAKRPQEGGDDACRVERRAGGDRRQDRKADRRDAVVEQAFGFDHHRHAAARSPSRGTTAMTDTGSVAAISTPNSAAPIQLQPMIQCMPAATTAAAMATPRNASVSVSGSSSRKRRQSSWSARLEHQRRQQDVEDELARQRQIGAGRQQRDQEAGDDQPDDVRQPEPPREHRDEAGDEEQDADRSERNAGHAQAISSDRAEVCPAAADPPPATCRGGCAVPQYAGSSMRC